MLIGNVILPLITLVLLGCSAAIIIELRRDAAHSDAAAMAWEARESGEDSPPPRLDVPAPAPPASES